MPGAHMQKQDSLRQEPKAIFLLPDPHSAEFTSGSQFDLNKLWFLGVSREVVGS